MHLLLVAVLCAAPDGGVPTPPPTWKTNGGLNQTQAKAFCRAELPSCEAPWATYVAPPHPCANRGAACPPELMDPRLTAGSWSCGCDECSDDAECGAGQWCGVERPVDPCDRSAPRQVNKCVPRPKSVKDAGASAMALIPPCGSLPPVPEASTPLR